jgi:hypothetical protein
VGLSDVLRDAGLAGYAEVALVLFVLAFALIAWRVLRRRRTRDWERARHLPLEDDVVLMPLGEDGRRGEPGPADGAGDREATRAGNDGRDGEESD